MSRGPTTSFQYVGSSFSATSRKYSSTPAAGTRRQRTVLTLARLGAGASSRCAFPPASVQPAPPRPQLPAHRYQLRGAPEPENRPRENQPRPAPLHGLADNGRRVLGFQQERHEAVPRRHLRPDEARVNHGNEDALAPQLAAQAFEVAPHGRLAGGVRVAARQLREQRQGAGNGDDAAAAALAHARQYGLQRIHGADKVHPHDILYRRRAGLLQPPQGAA